MLIANERPGNIAIHYGIKGPNLSIVTACATGAHSIGEAFRDNSVRDADVMVAGGTEANLTPLTVGGLQRIEGALRRETCPRKGLRGRSTRKGRLRDRRRGGIVDNGGVEHARPRGVLDIRGASGTATMATPTTSPPHAPTATAPYGA